MQQLNRCYRVQFYLNAYSTPLIEPNGSGFREQDRECMLLKTIKSKGHNTEGRDANHQPTFINAAIMVYKRFQDLEIQMSP